MRKIRTLEVLRQIYVGSSHQHPLVLAVENLHWIDPTSEAFLASLIEHLAGARLFVLLTCRPGYRPPWIDKSYVTQMVLPPLSAEDSRRLLGSALRARTISSALEQQILTKAQGNPFFLEEMAQTVVHEGTLRHERGMALPPDIPLPATVQDVLAARIDQLPPAEKRLLQTAAFIGKDVPFAVLQTITELSEEALRRGLEGCQAAEFLYEMRCFPVREYTFKHALTHEVAYRSLHQERRRTLHARIVEALEALYADRLDEQVERLAHHALRGEVWNKAVTYFRQAGVKAYDRAAFHEAVAAFEQALQALARLAVGDDTNVPAIDLRLALETSAGWAVRNAQDDGGL
jgi:predicted ATPase